MTGQVQIKGHPIHPMLIPFPIGLLVFSLLCDLIYAATGRLVWSQIAFYALAGGVIGGVVAAIPGLIDYRAIPPSDTKQVAAWHLRWTLLLIALFGLDLWMRTDPVPGTISPLILSMVGVALLGVSGWLGGEL